jgi:hypothetical protein
VIRGLVQRVAQTIYRGVQAVFEINKSIRGPEQGPQLFASDQVAGMVQEQFQDLKGLSGNTYALAAVMQFLRE